MIAKYIIFFLFLTIVPDLYIYLRYIRRRRSYAWWKGVLWFLPAAAMLAFAVYLASRDGFVSGNQSLVELYLLLFGIIVAPKAVYALCSFLGMLVCRLRKSNRNWGNLCGLLLAIYCIYVVVVGSTSGIRKLKVKEVDIAFDSLPAAFDGYRIALVSDLHVGTLSGKRQDILARAVDSINAQHADVIVFAGDLQNVEPQELYEHRFLLSSLKAADGVYSVLGNHDYSAYSDAGEVESAANERELQSIERQMGWTLLMNDRCVISRNGDSIVIAGLENHGKEPKTDSERKRFPQRGDTKKALSGIADNAFVVMVEHTPTAWRDLILPETKAQLTLSGHTHGGQVNLFGLRLTRFTYAEDAGLYWEGDRALYVTSGVGGLVPMRFGMPGEIVVITLRKK